MRPPLAPGSSLRAVRDDKILEFPPSHLQMADRPLTPWMMRACPWRLVKDALFGAPLRGEGVPPSSLSNLQGQANWPPWI